jgi:hypothetical protein
MEATSYGKLAVVRKKEVVSATSNDKELLFNESIKPQLAFRIKQVLQMLTVKKQGVPLTTTIDLEHHEECTMRWETDAPAPRNCACNVQARFFVNANPKSELNHRYSNLVLSGKVSVIKDGVAAAFDFGFNQELHAQVPAAPGPLLPTGD